MDLSNKTYELIGRLSFEYNKLQFFSAILYNSINKSPESGFVLLKEKGYPRLLDCINKSLEQKGLTNENQECIKNLVQEIIQIKESRNNLIHSLVFVKSGSDEEKVIPFFESIRRNEIIPKDINHSDLHELINKIKELGVQIIILAVNLNNIQKL